MIDLRCKKSWCGNCDNIGVGCGIRTATKSDLFWIYSVLDFTPIKDVVQEEPKPSRMKVQVHPSVKGDDRKWTKNDSDFRRACFLIENGSNCAEKGFRRTAAEQSEISWTVTTWESVYTRWSSVSIWSFQRFLSLREYSVHQWAWSPTPVA